MINWLYRILCFFGFHRPETYTKKVIMLEGRKAPRISYEKIPKDAQINAQIRLSYITDLWEEHYTCPSCSRVRVEQKTDHDILYYNQMIYLKGGKCYLATPDLIEQD